VRKCLAKCLSDHVWSRYDLLTSKSNQFISVHNCIEVADLVKLPQSICKILC